MNYHNSYGNQGDTPFARIKEHFRGRELEVLERFGFEIDGSRSSNEIRLRNMNRGADTGSSSWNVAKAVLIDFVDDGPRGDFIQVVAAVCGLDPINAVRRIADAFGITQQIFGENAARSVPHRTGRQYDRTTDYGYGQPQPGRPEREVEQDRPSAQQAAEDETERAAKVGAAQRLWNQGEPFEASVAANYIIGTRLRDRDVDITSDQLRFHAALQYRHDGKILGSYPGLIAPLRNARTGELTGVLRIYLQVWQDGAVTKCILRHPDASMEDFTSTDPAIRKKAHLTPKKLVGSWDFSSWVFGQPSDTLIVCEGIEDALSLFAATGGYVMAGGSAGQVGKAALPPGVTAVIVVPDANKAGEDGLVRAVQTYGAQGIKVLVARLPQGEDSNSVLLKYKDHTEGNAALKAFVDAAKPYAVGDDGEDAEPSAEVETPTAGDLMAKNADGHPLPPPTLMDIPGPLGDLCCHLREIDPKHDEVRGLAMGVAGFAALTSGSFFCQNGRHKTFTDLNIISVGASGTGKSTASDRVLEVIEQVVADAERCPWVELAGFGSPEGLWDLLEEINAKRRICAGVFFIDEFGSALSKVVKEGYSQGVSAILRLITNKGNRMMPPPPMSQRTKSAPRRALPYPVIGFAGATTLDQFTEALQGGRLLADGSEARLFVLSSPRTGRAYREVNLPVPDGLVDDLKRLWRVTRETADTAPSFGPPNTRVRVALGDGVENGILAMRAEEDADADKLEADGNPWHPLLRRRTEGAVKLAMLYAISEWIESKSDGPPRITKAALAWARDVSLYREAGHMFIREGGTVSSERTQEETQITERVHRAIKRLYREGRGSKIVREKGIKARDVMNSMKLPRELMAKAVDNLLHRHQIELRAGNGAPLYRYPPESQSLFLKPVGGSQKDQ